MPAPTGALSLTRRLRNRSERWITRRVPRESGPVRLERNRLYIFPTRLGLVFSLLLFVMLLGAMNYSNSLAFMLTFLLTSLALVGMHHTHGNLLHLRVESGRARRVFAGNKALFEVVVRNDSTSPRYSIRLATDADGHTDVAPGDSRVLILEDGTAQRGRVPAPRFKLVTDYPLGLFQAWSWIELDMHCLAYPRPLRGKNAHTTHNATGTTHHEKRIEGEDFEGLRAYRRGDPPQRIHWRAVARSREILVKKFSAPLDKNQWLDWDQFAGLAEETRLSRLCQCVLDAHRSGINYGLIVPGRQISPGSGEQHRRQCLEALALFPTRTTSHDRRRRK